MRKNVLLFVVCAAICVIFTSCQETGREKNIVVDNQDTQETFMEETIGKESDNVKIESLLDMTHGDMTRTGKTTTLSHYDGGASPVYELVEYEDIFVVFASTSDVAAEDSLEDTLEDQCPIKLLVRSSEVEVDPGLMVGMSAENVALLGLEWEKIYMSSENSLYYTTFQNDSRKVTAAWSIPEEMFSEWAMSLNDSDDYYSKFLEFIQPFKNEPVGTIVELTIEKAE